MKKIAFVLTVISVFALIFSCSSKNPSGPAADTSTVTMTASISPTSSISATHTVSPTITVTPTNTAITGPAVYIDAVLERIEDTDSAVYMIQVEVQSTPYPDATVSVDNIDDASAPISVPWNGSSYYLVGTGANIVPGDDHMVSVTIDGISHTATAQAPGNISLAADGMSVSWQFGEPDGNGGQFYVYRLSPFAVLYSGTAEAPSPFSVPYDPYTPGDGLHRTMLSQGVNYYEYQDAFVGCNGGSRIHINTHSERSDINK